MKHFRFLFALFLGCAAPVCSALATDILTNRGNNARTGLNANETVLTPSFVTSSSFGLVYNNPVDGQVYAQPLYVSNQLINGQSQRHNVLYVATEHDSLYAFDADTGVLYWKTSLLPTGESPVQANDPNINCLDLQPEIGITATPVIDKSAGLNGTIFVVAFSTDGSGGYFHRLHAIDLATGKDQNGIGPVLINPAPVIGVSPFNTFNATTERGRAGLLLLNGIIYTSWGSYCDNTPYSGWIIAYHENSLSQAAVFNANPNGSPPSPDYLPDGSGNGIWQDGTAPAVDSNNNIYVLTANGPFDENLTGGFPTNSDYGDSVLKLLTPSLSVSDYFTPFDELTEAENNVDLASGAAVVLPDIRDTAGTIHHFLVAAGKDTRLYLLDRDHLGHFNIGGDSIYQEMPLGTLVDGCYSSAAYFNGSVYLGGAWDAIYQFQFDFTNRTHPLLQRVSWTINPYYFDYPGATATISSNGTSSGIVWAIERYSASPPLQGAIPLGAAILHAYDATNLATELYNSGDLNIGEAVKFTPPTVCNGKVFVGTSNSIAAFGQIPPATKLVQTRK